MSVWWENGTLHKVHDDVEGTEMELEVIDEFGEVVTGARVSLQVTLFISITTLDVVLYHLDVLIGIPNIILIFSIQVSSALIASFKSTLSSPI